MNTIDRIITMACHDCRCGSAAETRALCEEVECLRAKRVRMADELLGELRSLLSLANAFCANSTAVHAEALIREIEQEAAEAAKEEK